MKENAGRLKVSSRLDTILEGSARYIEKQEIFLALCGKKPVSEVVRPDTLLSLTAGKASLMTRAGSLHSSIAWAWPTIYGPRTA